MDKPEIPKRWLASPKLQIFLFMVTVFYCLSPIDLIPDVVPIIGWFDDLGVILVEIIAFLKYLKYRRETPPKGEPSASVSGTPSEKS